MEMEMVLKNSGSLKRARSTSSSSQCIFSSEGKEVYRLVNLKDTSWKFTLKEKKIKTTSKQSLLPVEPRLSGSKNLLKGEFLKAPS